MIYKSFYQKIQKTPALKVVTKLSDGLFSYPVKDPSHILDKLSRYSYPCPPSRLELRGFLGKAYNAAFKATREAFVPSGYRVQPLSGSQISTEHLKSIEPRGFTFFDIRSKSWSEIEPQIVEESSKLMKSIIMDEPHFFTPPALIDESKNILHSENSLDHNKSLFLKFPAEVLYLESQWGVPLLKHLARVMPLSCYPSNYRSNFVTRIVEPEYAAPAAVLTLKIPDLESRVPHFLIDQAFDIVDEIFNSFQEQRFNSANTRAVLFDWLKWYFINTPIMLPDGGVIQKTHGIMSGSFFTYSIHTIIHYLLAQFVDSSLTLNSSFFFRSGDEISFYLSSCESNPLIESSASKDKKTDKACDFETLCRVFQSQFNMDLEYNDFQVAKPREYVPRLAPTSSFAAQWKPKKIGS